MNQPASTALASERTSASVTTDGAVSLATNVRKTIDNQFLKSLSSKLLHCAMRMPRGLSMFQRNQIEIWSLIFTTLWPPSKQDAGNVGCRIDYTKKCNEK